MTALNSTNCIGCGASDVTLDSRKSGFDMLRCESCGLRFVARNEQLQQVNYDELYCSDSHYSDHLNEIEPLKRGELPPLVKTRRAALERIKQMQPRTFLEVGCGVGNFLKWIEHISEQQAQPIQSYGLDLSANAISLASSHLKSQLHCGELNDRVFPGVNFDVICSWEVIEHVHDPGAFINTIRSRLTSGGGGGGGGTLFMSTPNYASHWLWNDVGGDPRGTPPVHVTFWCQRSITTFLQRHGFGRIAVQHCSIPLNAAQRSGGVFGRLRAVAECLASPKARSNLLVEAHKN